MADESDEQMPAMADVYYQLDDGGALARLEGGWNHQVWIDGTWTNVDIDFATEAREIPEATAQALMAGGEGFGEFGPEEGS